MAQQKEVIDLTVKGGHKPDKIRWNKRTDAELHKQWTLLNANIRDLQAKHNLIQGTMKQNNPFDQEYVHEKHKIITSITRLNEVFAEYEWKIYEKNTKQ